MQITDEDVLWVHQLVYAYESYIARKHYMECDYLDHIVKIHLENDDVLKKIPEWARIDIGPKWNPANDPALQDRGDVI